MSVEELTPKKTDFKYKIGKVKQTPQVLKDERTGLDYIELKQRQNERVDGCTVFQGHYKEDKKLGQGTFGEVYRGVHLETQRQVAMKRTLVKAEKDLFPITAQREITILRKLNHKNVIKLIEMVYDYPPSNPSNSNNHSTPATPNASPSRSFYMILPYMVADMSGILHNPRIKLEMGAIKNVLLQILEGVNYIHCQKFMHRDIKTANLLIDHKGRLKIADFGLARNYYGAPPNLRFPGGAGVDAKYTSVVVTRWYRAPELVLGDKYYTTAVDMWGVGCVFGELFEKKPILQGQTDVDQGHVIFKLLGTPTEEQWPLARYLPGAELTRTKYTATLRERFGSHLSDTGLDLLGQLLCLDPYKRLTAMSAKNHPFFKEEPLPAKILQLPCEECHEADIKRYKQEQNRSLSQQPPPAPQGHIVEKPTPVTPQLPKGPKGPKSNKVLKPATGPRGYSDSKRAVPRQGAPSSIPAPTHPRNASDSENSRGSRYSRGPSGYGNPGSNGGQNRNESRFNSGLSRNRYYNQRTGNSLDPQRTDSGDHTNPTYSGSQGLAGESETTGYFENSRYGHSTYPRHNKPYAGQPGGTENPNDTPIRNVRGDKTKSFPPHPVNHEPRNVVPPNRPREDETEPHHKKSRQNYQSAQDDIADLY
ncbi:LANO_0H24674g1_1 [Lachancea nothofagi CBS 11611]|uniref:Serine/threonine-protein kinase BUR1 n=1 Tax=Lachancea nothofagi CBS 11611 TaxID=1266666 RepID=A0A1G4KNT8_9SACH|nr:LANO_0H24674g1_1 [Lachancea nothofagi CBS 11611]